MSMYSFKVLIVLHSLTVSLWASQGSQTISKHTKQLTTGIDIECVCLKCE